MLPRGQTVPVFCGSAAGTPFKQGAEIGRIIVARQIADLIHLDLRIRQKFFGLFYPDRGQKILLSGRPRAGPASGGRGSPAVPGGMAAAAGN